MDTTTERAKLLAERDALAKQLQADLEEQQITTPTRRRMLNKLWNIDEKIMELTP